MSPKSKGQCPYERRGHRNREEGHVKMQAEIKVTLPQAKKCQDPLEAG